VSSFDAKLLIITAASLIEQQQLCSLSWRELSAGSGPLHLLVLMRVQQPRVLQQTVTGWVLDRFKKISNLKNDLSFFPYRERQGSPLWVEVRKFSLGKEEENSPD
jgi:hypothetical protein